MQKILTIISCPVPEKFIKSLSRSDWEALRDRFVLVGATATGLGDLLPTPVSGEGRPMPGVEIVANVLDALRQDLAIEPVGAAGRLLLSLILVLLPTLLYPLTSPRWSLAIGAGSLLLGHVLPMSGCTLCDLFGVACGSWGEVPQPAPERPQAAGAWIEHGGNLWQLIARRSGDLWLGIHWNARTPPSPAQAELLQTLANRFAEPSSPAPRRTT